MTESANVNMTTID